MMPPQVTDHQSLFTTIVPVAQPDRASDFGSEGWGFESLQARHFSRFVAIMSPLFGSVLQPALQCGMFPSLPVVGWVTNLALKTTSIRDEGYQLAARIQKF